MRILPAIALLLITAQILPSRYAVAELAPFDHYRVILDRKPFGDLTPPKQDTPAAPVVDQTEIEEKKKEDELAKQIAMVAVNRTPRGKIAVGFIDKNAKPPRNYYLNVGDTSGGFTVLEADFEEETAMIEKDGVSIALKLGKGVIPKPEKNGQEATTANDNADPVAATLSPQPTRPALAPSRFAGRSGMPGLRNAPSIGGAPNARPGLSYADRVRERKAQETREAAARDREAKRQMEAEVEKRLEASKADAAKREREINIELIKRGEAPVSDIELTEEEDAALVEAGALPQQ